MLSLTTGGKRTGFSLLGIHGNLDMLLYPINHAMLYFVGFDVLPPFAAALALELAPVRVNLIAAGFVDTPLSASLLGDRLDERRNELRATLPIGRVVTPADVAALAVHIMSNTALTGATYDIDGGQQFVS